MTLIIGSNGSMGRRYQAILRYLGKKFSCVDVSNIEEMGSLIKGAESFIIATPTDTHADYIRKLLPYRKPILCEKPVCKDIEVFRTVMTEIHASKTPFRMMFQYSLLSEANKLGRTSFNYFKHGSDGLVWDCAQIIGLARGGLELSNSSPVWTCVLNGLALNIRDMDAAYIGYVQRWFAHPAQNLEKLIALHEKTHHIERTGFYG